MLNVRITILDKSWFRLVLSIAIIQHITRYLSIEGWLTKDLILLSSNLIN